MEIQSAEFRSSYAAVYVPGRRSRVSYCYGNGRCPHIGASIPCLTYVALNSFTFYKGGGAEKKITKMGAH